jgi:hypothetical protein
VEPDDFATFRAAYPSIRDAIARCDRPDWAVRLAFDSGRHRETVVRIGAHTARFLCTSNMRSAMEFFTPWPGALEAVDVWSHNTDKYSPKMARVRARAIAGVLAIPFTIFGDHYLLAAALGTGLHRIVAVGAMFFFATVVLSELVRFGLASIVRRRAADLDADEALRIVTARIVAGMAKNPSRVPVVMRSIRTKLGDVVGGT